MKENTVINCVAHTIHVGVKKFSHFLLFFTQKHDFNALCFLNIFYFSVATFLFY